MAGPWVIGHRVAWVRVHRAFRIYFGVQPKGKTDGEATVETF